MSVSNLPLVLITGGSGYIGAHVVQHTLEAGYPVRLTARPGKVESLRNTFKGTVNVYGVSDIATGDYTEALKGVGALIHLASPIAGTEDRESMLKNTIEGTLNIVRQAVTSGVKRIVITGSIVSHLNIRDGKDHHINKTITEKDWNPVTKEELLSGEHDNDAIWVYGAVKALNEQAIWKFADDHPEVDISIINPTFVYGPIASGVKIPKGDFKALSTAALFYMRVLPVNASTITIDRPQDDIPVTVDVRDVARAHVLALRAPPTSEVGRKRFPLTGPNLTWVDTVIHLRKAMPELAERLPKVAEGAESSDPLPCPTVDTTRAKKVLGIDRFIDWRTTAEDTIRSLLAIEKDWASTANA